MTEMGDHSDALFVGREEQLEVFTPIREKVIGGGSAVVGVSGRAGTGKTLLMRHLASTIDAEVSGYGKYDAVRTRPYEGIASALTDLVAQMSHSPKGEAWESDLSSSLGEGAAALTTLVPELGDVLDTPGPGAPAGPEAHPDSEAMLLALQQAVTALVKSISRHCDTVTLIVDDLQWAGQNTLAVMRRLTNASVSGLLVVAAWRDLEGQEPDSERYRGLFDHVYELGGFDDESLIELFQALTGRTPDEPVLVALERETRGNPQFAVELIAHDTSEGRLAWDGEAGRWKWDRIEESAGLIGGLEHLLLDRLERMPAAEADMIATAAALGTAFDVHDLTAASGSTPERVNELLGSSAARSFLVPADSEERRAGGRYRFAHDRIAEITTRRLSPNQLKEANVRLARSLIDNDPERLSDALIHLSAGLDLITDSGERSEMAWLAVAAGNDSRRQAAFSIALQHFQTGLDLVAEQPADKELVSNLSVGAAEAAWLAGDVRVGQLLQRAKVTASTLVDRARLTTVEMKLGLAGHAGLSPQDALQAGLSMSKELGIELPSRPTDFGVLTSLLGTRRRLAGYSMDEVANLPLSDDAEAIWAEQVLGEMFSTSYAVDPDLFPFVVLEAVNLTLDRGRLPMTPVALAAYGLLLVVVADNPLLEVTRPKLATRFYEEAYNYGRLAMRMADFTESTRYRPWTHFLFYDFINHWHQPIRESLPAVRAAEKEALEVGDPAYGAYLGDVEIGQMVTVGHSMADVHRRGRAVLDQMGPGQEKQHELAEILVQFAELLAQPDDRPPYVISGNTGYDEKTILARPDEDAVSLSVLWNMKLVLAVLSGHYEEAPEFGEQTNRYLSGLAGTTIVPFHHMLNAYGLARTEPRERSTRSALKTAIRKYERWQELSPANYRAGYRLMLGMAALTSGDTGEATRRLGEAIATSRADDLPIVEALSHLAAAEVADDDEAAEAHLVAAAGVWASIGNVAGLEQLQRNHPDVAPLMSITPDPDALPGEKPASQRIEASLLNVFGLDTDIAPAAMTVSSLVAGLTVTVGKLEPGKGGATELEMKAMETEIETMVSREIDRHNGWMTPEGRTALFRSGEDAARAALDLVSEQSARNQRAARGGGLPLHMHLGLALDDAELTVETPGKARVAGPVLETAARLAETAERQSCSVVTAAALHGVFEDAGAKLEELAADDEAPEKCYSLFPSSS